MIQSSILFVDDEPFILNSLRDMAEMTYIVHTAENGQRALELVKKFPIKVVVCDQRMPGMFGHEVLKKVREINPNIIRILLTGYSDLESIISSVNAGEIFRYISKPWKSDHLLSTIKLAVSLYDRIVGLQDQTQRKNASSPNLGTSFGTLSSTATMKAPVQPLKPQPPAAQPPMKTHIEVQEKNLDVLFVDFDSEQINTLVSRFANNFTVSGVTTIDDALTVLAQRPVSVIVSNVSFSPDDGMEFLTVVKAEFPEMVTVILTEINDVNIAVRSINELHVFRYLVKPTSPEVISQTLSDALSQSQRHRTLPNSNLNTQTRFLESMPNRAQTESSLILKLRAAQEKLSKARNV